MANVKPKRAVVDKWKKKKRYILMGPKEVGNIELGETIADKPETLINRRIKVNMGVVLNQAKKKNVDITFRIKDVQGSNAVTELIGYETKQSYLRRLFRRRCSKIGSVLYLTTKDNKKIKFNSVVVTLRKIEHEKRRDIRKIVEDFIVKTVKANNFDALIGTILQKELLMDVLPEIKKIAGIKKTEIGQVKQLS